MGCVACVRNEMIRIKSTTHIGTGSIGGTGNHANDEQSQNRTPATFARPPKPAGIRGRGRRGESLASGRDRQRLRERNAAERERVEGMMASGAVPLERRAHSREPAIHSQEPFPIGLRAVPPTGCPVCGDGRTVTDEVMHGGTLRVSECLHCEHRWTQRPRARWAEIGASMNRAGRLRALELVGDQHQDRVR
jgi:hypothetical protein